MEIKIFKSPKFGEIRTSLGVSNEPFFCLSDVCKALEFFNSRDVKARLNPKGVSMTDTLTNGGFQQLTFISEANLYKCIFQSRKKEAEQFQDWIYDEVLPSIRKNGGYIATTSDDSPELIMARALQVAQATIEKHKQKLEVAENEIKVLAPKAEYTDKVLQSANTYTLTQIAHDCGLRSVHVLTSTLRKNGILYRQSNQWQPTAKVADKGCFATRTAVFTKKDDTQGTNITTVVTESGRNYIHNFIANI